MADLGKSDVVVDICVQRDYLNGNPHLRCRNASTLMGPARKLMALARWAKLPVLSCVDIHRPHDIGDQYVTAPADAAPVDKMLPFTRLPSHVVIESDNCLFMALDVLDRYQQAIFTKVQWDPFTNPKLDRLFTEMPARRFVIFGIPLESSVRLLTLGLLRRGRQVALVTDACGYFNDSEASMVLRQLSVKGCQLLTSDTYVRDCLAQLNRRDRFRFRKRYVA